MSDMLRYDIAQNSRYWTISLTLHVISPISALKYLCCISPQDHLMCGPQSTLHAPAAQPQGTVNNLLCTLYTLYCTLESVLYTLYCTHFVLYTLYCSLLTAPPSLHCRVYSAHSRGLLYRRQYSSRFGLCPCVTTCPRPTVLTSV